MSLQELVIGSLLVVTGLGFGLFEPALIRLMGGA
jgi:hypothetical protein